MLATGFVPKTKVVTGVISDGTVPSTIEYLDVVPIPVYLVLSLALYKYIERTLELLSVSYTHLTLPTKRIV